MFAVEKIAINYSLDSSAVFVAARDLSFPLAQGPEYAASS
jgi:hypothetical protein